MLKIQSNKILLVKLRIPICYRLLFAKLSSTVEIEAHRKSWLKFTFNRRFTFLMIPTLLNVETGTVLVPNLKKKSGT